MTYKKILFPSALIFVSLAISCSTSEVSAPDASAALRDPQGAQSPQATSAIPDKREFPVDSSVNPCTDFYAYTCNKVNESFKLPENRSYHTFSFSDSSERILEKKKKFLEGLRNGQAKTKRQEMLRSFYVSCMDEDAAKKEEKQLVSTLLKEVDDLKDREKFQSWLAARILTSESSFLGIDRLENADEPLHYDALLTSSLQRLPERSYYGNAEVLAEWRKVISKGFKEAGLPDPDKRASGVIDFEKRFSQTYPIPEEIRELITQKKFITREDLLKKFPALKLAEVLKKIPGKTLIRDFTPDNFKFLNEALSKESLETLKDVYLAYALHDYMDDAYPEYFKSYFDFRHKYLGGPAARPDRLERCTDLVKGYLGRELDAELLPIMFPDFPDKKFVALAEKIRGSILEGLKHNKWLSKKAKAAAIEKIKTAPLQLVKPQTEEEWDFAPVLTYDDKQPYENMRKLRSALVERTLSEFGVKRNPKKWGMGPLTVNAYYDPTSNKFVMPIGILQPPFYDHTLSDEVNAGAVGAVIGHELGHGIDDMGSRFDSKGRLKSWMTARDLKEFQKRGTQLVGYFNKAGVNGKLTLGENIGDLVGLTFAYNMAFPKGKGTAEEKRQFFTQFGRLWCQTIRPKFAEKLLKVDSHSPSKSRVNEQMKHQPAFEQVFACKKTDALILPDKDRVRIW